MLTFQKNKLNDLPTTVQNSTNLQFVKIGGNDFTAIPSAISKLENLVRLDAHTNKIAEIPEWLSDSKKAWPVTDCLLTFQLEKLGLKENNLTAISPAFGRMKNLNYLDLSNNKIDRLPIAFVRRCSSVIMTPLPGMDTSPLDKDKLGRQYPSEGNSRRSGRLDHQKDRGERNGVYGTFERVSLRLLPLSDACRNVLMIIGEKGSGKTNLYNSIVAGWTEKICGVKTQVRPKKKKSNIRKFLGTTLLTRF